jgi:hypothetical protein
VRQILTNPVYIGERHCVGKANTPIINRRLWNATQAALAARARAA